MPTFYFHVRRGSVVFEDREGRTLSSVKAALAKAADDARAVMRDEPEVPAKDQWIEIVDAGGTTVRTLPFVTVEGAH